ncbi:dihydropteroate synthase-like protein [Pyrococcus abyssi]|uniref:Dihydropteroate synthase n=1 Tax=Pyrococcus abyssi (strain GE5 / Orsay) TaxID=272844 RepID=Q9V220_PYRAB|nr:dihydropteroate synthase-like protein [Pyrococcus abyssi]CAB49178.1 Pterin binding enzyme, possibly dihydropteroate synthase [Pyrococcus abyssi GE5]CCE69631.1 TPA: dihydropteroate synthase [Pyrococcus abyssi GE5]
MKILLVTGRLAEPLVRKYGKGCDVFVAPVTVAAFLTPRMIADFLEKAGVKGYDMILIPGLVRGSTEVIEERIGIPTFKGPRNAVDLPVVLKAIKQGFKLSKEIPADELFSRDSLKKVRDIRNKTRNKSYVERALKKPWNFLVGSLPVGLDFPTRIVAEIVDAPRLSPSEIKKRAEYYLGEGADIIDLGMISGETNLEFIETIPELKEMIDAPISLDSLNTKELERGLEFVDMVLSVDWGNVEELITDKPVVLIPTDMKRGKFYSNPQERVESLEKLKELATSLGYKRIIVDPILEHYPNFSRSLVAFYLYRSRNERDVMLAGVGNVTEMMDADSPGINALLASISSELKLSLLLTTEVSRKCVGSIRELRRGIDMTLLGGVKDVGLDLLILKEKRPKSVKFEVSRNLIKARRKDVKLEKIYFRIFTDKDEIYVNAYRGTELVMTIVGSEPNEIIDTILEMFNISPRHAFYLGRELEKAFTAIKLRKSYVQEGGLFTDFYSQKSL